MADLMSSSSSPIQISALPYSMFKPSTIWLTGLSGAGKSTLGKALASSLKHQGIPCCSLDGDELRHGLNKDLGFSEADRRENIRRVAEVARLMNHAGLVVVASFISPYRADRENARNIIGPSAFHEVYLSTSLEVCEARDPKKLYARARAGEIAYFTGLSAPYEPPLQAQLTLDTAHLGLSQCIDTLCEFASRCIATPDP
ncbi:MAG: adenylyl-sulfate kinase [Comamonas sp.]|nr:adenylyl-sulfate kinase [Comamonas sp.]